MVKLNQTIMTQIRVVFYELSSDRKKSEVLFTEYPLEEPDYKEGEKISLIEAEFMEDSDIGKLAFQDRKPTHEFVKADPPVVVYTKKPDTEEKAVLSKIYIYYLKKIENKPGLPLSTIAGMFP